MSEIKYPTQTTYFIAYTNNRVCAWGVVEPNQEMSSGQPYLYQTINKNEWLLELNNYYVVWGYQFYNLETAETYKIMINNYYDSDVAEIKYAEYNNPTFWYIEGDFTDATKDEPVSFQVYPN
jgi:hypothetical protein